MTLIEMMAVLAIFAVAAGAATLALRGADRGSAAEAEARRLAAALGAAADGAILSASPRRLEVGPGGWRIEAEGAARELPSGMRLEMTTPAGDVRSLVIPPDADGPPARLRLAAAGGSAWSVRFDGLRARAVPAEARP